MTSKPKTSSATKIAALSLGFWLTLFAGIASSDTPTAGPWKQLKEQDGIKVYQREAPGWSIKEIRATGLVEASLQTLFDIVNDVKYASDINEIVSKAGRIEQDDPERDYYFIVLDMPWPTSDRSAVYARQIIIDEEQHTITLADKADSEMVMRAEMEGTVRMVRSTQKWTLRKIDEDTTEVTLTSLTDPNGPIPAFIINSMSVDAPMQSIANLRKLAGSVEKDQGIRKY